MLSSQDTERGQLEIDMLRVKEELKEKSDVVRQKELQLSSFGRALQELEDTTRFLILSLFL